MHAETVLLVDHDEAELREFDAFLHQRVRADGDRPDLSNAASACARALPCSLPASQTTSTPSGASHAAEIAVMLLGEHFGRRHQRDLISGFDAANAASAATRSCRNRRRPARVAASASRAEVVDDSAATRSAPSSAERQVPGKRRAARLAASAGATCARRRERSRFRLRCWASSSSNARRCCAGCAPSATREIGVRRRPMHVKQRFAQRRQLVRSRATPAESVRAPRPRASA